LNYQRQTVACKLTPGNANDTAPVLTQELISKLCRDKGSVGKDLAERSLRRGPVLMTQVRCNVKRLRLDEANAVPVTATKSYGSRCYLTVAIMFNAVRPYR
jgi:hypothetical protein